MVRQTLRFEKDVSYSKLRIKVTLCENNRLSIVGSIDRAKFSLVTRPTKMGLIRESIIILKNWLKILLQLIREGDLYSNIYDI